MGTATEDNQSVAPNGASNKTETAAGQETPVVDKDDIPTLDDPTTDQAIDDIVANESDELLAVQDAAAHEGEIRPRPGRWHRFWRSRTARYGLLFALLASLTAIGLWQPSRYWMLNTVGVRGSSSVQVTDQVTHQPIKNAQVEIAGVRVRTGNDGKVTVHSLKLGPTMLKVRVPGFASYDRPITIGWGSNPLGMVSLKAVGVQYTLHVQDFLTGKGIAGAEISSGEAIAVSDKNGDALLTLSGAGTPTVALDVSREGYRPEHTALKVTAEQFTPIALVTERKAVFVSKQSGKFDVYSSDVDGQNKQVILAGTGNENANISLVVSPDGTHAAVVSTRDNKKDADGFLLNTLTIITVSNGDNVTIAHAEQIKIIDWIGSRLIFEQVSSSAATPVAGKYSIIAYDYASTSRLQLAAASTLKSVLSVQNAIYYVTAMDESDTSSKSAFYKVDPDGTGKQTILDKEVWSVFRTEYQVLSLQTSEGWYTYNVTTGNTAPISAPASYVSRLYAESPAKNGQSVWADIRDDQGALMRYDKQASKDTEIQKQVGLTNPIRWLTDDALLYRVVNGNDIADYVVSATGGTAHKVAEVSNTYGFSAGQ